MLWKHSAIPLPQKVLNSGFPKETKLQFEDCEQAYRVTKRHNITRQDHVLLTFLGVLSAFIMVGILCLRLPGNLTAGNPHHQKRRKRKKKGHCMDAHLSNTALQLLVERKKLGQAISIFLFPLKSPGTQLGKCTRNVCVNDCYMTTLITIELCKVFLAEVPYV